MTGPEAIDRDSIAEFALSLPGAHQSSHFDVVDFRVNNKIFCTLPKPGKLGLRLSPDEQAALVAEDPRTYEPARGSYGQKGWTLTTLATADPSQIRELIAEAWRLAAPKKLLAQLNEDES